MITRETKVVHTTDSFMKVIFTIIVVCLVWLSVKNTPMEPVVTAQGGVYTQKKWEGLVLSATGPTW